jgi:hypothetical protein
VGCRSDSAAARGLPIRVARALGFDYFCGRMIAYNWFDCDKQRTEHHQRARRCEPEAPPHDLIADVLWQFAKWSEATSMGA